MRPTARGILGVILLTGAFTGLATAQTTYPNVKLTGRLQEQSYYFGNEAYAAGVGPRSGIFTRRARIEARGNISENVSVFIQPSFEGGRNLSNLSTTCTSTEVPAGGGTPTITCRTTGRSGLRLRDAYIDVRFSKEAEQVGALPAGRPGEAALQPLRADLSRQSAFHRARRGPGAARPGVQRPFRIGRLHLARRGRERPPGAPARRPPPRHREAGCLQRPGREPERRERQEESSVRAPPPR